MPMQDFFLLCSHSVETDTCYLTVQNILFNKMPMERCLQAKEMTQWKIPARYHMIKTKHGLGYYEGDQWGKYTKDLALMK